MAGAPHWFNAISQHSGMLPVRGEMTYQDPATGLEYTIKVKDPSSRMFRRKKKKKERPVSDGYEHPVSDGYKHPVRPLPPPPPQEIKPLELDSNSEFEDPVYRPFPTSGSSSLDKKASVTVDNDHPDSRQSPTGNGEEEETVYLSLSESDDGVGESEDDSYDKESDELYVRLKAAQKQKIMSKDRPTIAKE